MEVLRNGRSARVVLQGDLQLAQSRALYDELSKLSSESGLEVVILDFEKLDHLDSSGIAVISVASEIFAAAGRELHVENVSDSQQKALEMMPARDPNQSMDPPRIGFFESLGDWGLDARDELSAYFAFVSKLLSELSGLFLRGQRMPKGSVVHEAVVIGVDAFPIVALSSVLIGLVLGFQAADQLIEFGATVYVSNLVGVSMAREFGPLMTGIILAGRSGSAIAAELGTMKVQEELDALKTMGLEPERYLALPKMFAITLVGPSLTLLSIVLGMVGGMIIGVFYVDMSPTLYMTRTMEAVDPVDVWHGVWKSFIFAWLIGSIGCFCGVRIEGGASGVGRATTRSVVMGIFMLIVADAIGTSLSTVAGGWL